MAAKKKASKKKKQVESYTHEKAKRRNIPTAEYESVMEKEQQKPIRLSIDRRNPDLDPQLVWRGKDRQDAEPLVTWAPPLFIQEVVKPKDLIANLQKETYSAEQKKADAPELFRDSSDELYGLDSDEAKTEFYQHDANWMNRMILGDSLQVMASLAEREGLRGKVQCVYIDPPYGIKFNSNFQWSTTTRDVTDGKADHITREAEQVKAFRDTWRDGVHSYLAYLRDRIQISHHLLSEFGSIFVQIGDENVHRVRAVLDEVFGEDNFVGLISFVTSTGRTSGHIDTVSDYLIWYAKSIKTMKYNQLYNQDIEFTAAGKDYKGEFELGDLTSQHPSDTRSVPLTFRGEVFKPTASRQWAFDPDNLSRLEYADRVVRFSANQIRWKKYPDERARGKINNIWTDTQFGAFASDKIYVVQTHKKVIERCIQMASNPGDLVLDPTCGSGTTAYVAEQWGRRWITIDTSRVALALARARIMAAKYPYYLLKDSKEGQLKEAKLARKEAPSMEPTYSDLRHGFVYERVPHVTLKSIANNSEIDVIWESFQKKLEPLREMLNTELRQTWKEWEIPYEPEEEWPGEAKKLHADWWKQRIARHKEINTSIAAKTDSKDLYDKPYEDKKKVRVAGPFTVESLSPHRTLEVDEHDELVDPQKRAERETEGEEGFVKMVLENLKRAGVQQVHKEDKISFTSLKPWPGSYIAAEGRYIEGDPDKGGADKRAGIFIGPEFGTVARQHLVEAAKEAGDAGFDVVIACAFNYDAHATEFDKLGRIPVLKARMNADLHMSEDLKNTGKGNLFVIFGEPDINIQNVDGGQVRVQIKGVDVFDPSTGEVRSDDPDGIAAWFIDTDYNGESFFVRHAYFLGQNNPYESLKKSLKAEINEGAWATLNSDTSRPFPKPQGGRIAVKVINHLGDEVMKVYEV